jgi:hypothetical protein
MRDIAQPLYCHQFFTLEKKASLKVIKIVTAHALILLSKGLPYTSIMWVNKMEF